MCLVRASPLKITDSARRCKGVDMTATAPQNEGSLPVPWRLILNRASREMLVIGIRDVVIRELPIVTHDVNFEEAFFSL